jgi:hypothetical protein
MYRARGKRAPVLRSSSGHVSPNLATVSLVHLDSDPSLLSQFLVTRYTSRWRFKDRFADRLLKIE